jgi:hypothetical protein
MNNNSWDSFATIHGSSNLLVCVASRCRHVQSGADNFTDESPGVSLRLLLHGGRGGWLPDSDERATELFSALMAVRGSVLASSLPRPCLAFAHFTAV